MARTACVVFAAWLAVAGTALTAQRNTLAQVPKVTNDYVRVWKFLLQPGESFTLPDNTDTEILISATPSNMTETDVTQAKKIVLSSQVIGPHVGHTFLNGSHEPMEWFLLDLQEDPGKITCTHADDCPWSIRSGADPTPLILSEHVTVFRLALPWKPEPNSLVIPESDLMDTSVRHAVAEPFWITAPTLLTQAGAPTPQPSPAKDRLAEFVAQRDYFLEVAFYDKPFCFCKRVGE